MWLGDAMGQGFELGMTGGSMPEKKYVVPEGMRLAAEKRTRNCVGTVGQYIQAALEAAIQWLAENPIRPPESFGAEMRGFPGNASESLPIEAAIEWQRQMFLAPETPEERMQRDVDAIMNSKGTWSGSNVRMAVTEAYLAGVAAAAERK